MQPDSAASQPQRLAYAQAAPPACRVGVALPWQPQAQVVPGQLAHWHAEAKSESMGVLSGVGEPGGFVGTNSAKAPRLKLERNG